MRLLNSLCALLILTAFQATANERLFEPPREVFGRVSPDGSRLAVVARDDNGFTVDAIDLRTSVRETFFATSSLGDGEFIVSAMSWVDNDTLVLRIIEITEGIAKLSDTRNKQHNIVVDAISDAPKIRHIKTCGCEDGPDPYCCAGYLLLPCHAPLPGSGPHHRRGSDYHHSPWVLP